VQVTIVSAWNGPSGTLADRVAHWQTEFPDVVFEQFLVDGPVLGTRATQNDLDAWRVAHPGVPVKLLEPSDITVVFDPDAVPLVAYVDPKTNEVIASEVGFVPTDDAAKARVTWNGLSKSGLNVRRTYSNIMSSSLPGRVPMSARAPSRNVASSPRIAASCILAAFLRFSSVMGCTQPKSRNVTRP